MIKCDAIMFDKQTHPKFAVEKTNGDSNGKYKYFQLR